MKGASIKILSILLAIGILYPSLAPIVALAAPVTLDKASPVNMGICYDKNGKQIGSVPLMPDACKSSGGVTMDQAISPSNPAGKPVAKSSGGSILEKTAGCSAWNLVGYDLFECLIQVIDYVAYGVVYYIAGWITGIAGNALSYTLGLTINNKFYTNINAITAGWEFSRDIVNIFFIFAILLIAIATILGIESYGAKKLLATLIIAALLVNFSLLATQAIIFVTNALTYELYNSVNSKIAPSSLLQSADPGFRKDISAELMSGLLQQKIFASNPGTTYAGAAALAAPTSQFQINMAVLVTIVAAAFIMIFAAFIFLAGAFFFIARMAMLWILMVVAPFGFVLLVLPATKGYAQKWWLTLQSQAFFAPAFMFFILITIKMVQSDPLGLMGKIKSLGGSPPTTDLLFLLILQNMVIFIFLGASLLVAKAAGIYGADGAMKMAQKGGQWFRGATGRMAMAPVRGARQAAAPLAEKV
ncbi:MAG: hypothetical protein HYT21_03355, partial [Candidatus Nealsonbacteria bacterium]|nr:hypothetical protein [Candidatus Nealsonbacteria bacterium]